MKTRFSFCIAVLLLMVAAVCTAAEPAKKAKNTLTPPKLEQDGAWTMVVIPDPQQYTSQKNYPLYELMMNWIAANIEPLNILHVVCVGDIVNGNKASAQWNYSSNAFKILDGKIAYALCTGNHDYGGPKVTADSRDTNFNKFFPKERNPSWEGVVVSMGENAFGVKTLENAAYEKRAPNGQIVLVITLPFAPTDANLKWAKDLAAQKKYENAFVIVATHQYMLPDARENVRDNQKHYKLLKEGGNDGEDMWQKLVFPSKNIRMVLSGHHSAADKFQDCTGFRKDKNSAGKTVYQIVFDTQALGGGWGGNGGDGWLRLMEFSKDMKHVKAKTWSTFFAMSPTTWPFAWERSAYNQYEFDID